VVYVVALLAGALLMAAQAFTPVGPVEVGTQIVEVMVAYPDAVGQVTGGAQDESSSGSSKEGVVGQRA
jgi:hypothetical protein